ncbi:hypothetical protein IC007_2303 [Sulfuracidifex tepidarius]|uniref:Uncharacterized protein n=1 Tax=Sulfuracidifex tepidarius TaxID=1294262 RepID=A0A510E5I0_9CREN|nr:hypothetical protein IC007_2303 [Sulfuracidifex tepidarius]
MTSVVREEPIMTKVAVNGLYCCNFSGRSRDIMYSMSGMEGKALIMLGELNLAVANPIAIPRVFTNKDARKAESRSKGAFPTTTEWAVTK